MTHAIRKIVAGATTGTAAMTAFSYIATDAENKEFREPEVLRMLVKRLFPEVSETQGKVAGWALHFGAGIFFTTIYHQLWKNGKQRPSLINGLLLGGINGLVGVAIWKAAFALHPKPPKIFEKNYFGHLLLAHLVFGLATAAGYKKA